jgi:hypothetical protein
MKMHLSGEYLAPWTVSTDRQVETLLVIGTQAVSAGKAEAAEAEEVRLVFPRIGSIFSAHLQG